MQYLKFIKYIGKNKWNRKVSLYNCTKCGKNIEIQDTYVRTGKKIDCGCGDEERKKQRYIKRYGKDYISKKSLPEYTTWINMKTRCYNKTYQHYDRYGGRGIKVCDEWINDFDRFYADMGKKPASNYQLDRIDNNGNYSPDNCRWTTPSQNCYNRSRYHNKTGFTGVCKNTHGDNRYSAWFSLNRKHIQVGTYSSPEEAYKARIEAIKRYNKEHNANLEYIEYEDFIKDIV